jgi:nucleoside-diphosphate-sugar epimerase
VRGITTKQLPPTSTNDSIVYHRAGKPYSENDWTEWFRGADAVVHLAALVHQMHGGASAGDYDLVNHQSTRVVAERAAQAGVRTFVFLSSIKVNGDASPPGGYAPGHTPSPVDDYGRSKWLAEQALRRISEQTQLRIDIIRPPLVYGPGVGANFLRLMRWVERGYPLPLAAIRNRRSLVSVWNLCDLIGQLIDHHGRAGGVWMVSDGEDVSTAALIAKIAAAMSTRPRLFPVPPALLLAAGRLLGQGDALSRLCDSLIVDITLTRGELNWNPPLPLDEGLRRTVSWYQTQARASHVG